MGGNVTEWCMDWYNADKTLRVVRGASWCGINPEGLLSSRRGNGIPGGRDVVYGFRCVLVGESSP
jgi:formylglycine-generating enzyme required for sulfatase activity